MKAIDILKIGICCVFVMVASSCSAQEAPKEAPKESPKEAAATKAAVTQQAPVSTPEPLATDHGPLTTDHVPEVSKYDFSDTSHWNLTVSAWERLAAKDYEGVFAYAEKCLELYEAEAKEKAKSMHNFVGFGHEDDYAVVNDVATSHYIMGEAYMRMGDPANALKKFDLVIQEYPYAQCWDPKGWFWKVAEVSKKNIDKIEKAKVEKNDK